MGTDIDGLAAGDYFGASVAMSGDSNKIVVGGYLNDGNGIDSVLARVFVYVTNN